MLKILVVDDDAELNRSVCRYLEMNGYETVGCLDAVSAYDTMYGSSFDCIISDIMMPKIDGFEFAESVRSRPRKGGEPVAPHHQISDSSYVDC